MLSDLQLQQFHRDGFLKGGRVIDDRHLDQLKEELARVIRDQKTDAPQPVSVSNLTGDPERPVWQIVNIWEASEAYRRLVDHTTIVQQVAQLLGSRGVAMWHDQIQYKPAQLGGVNMWHQDWPYWPIMDAPTALTAWIALDDAGEDNGCMSMVPGSHLVGNTIRFLESIPSFDAMPTAFQGKDIQVKLCPVAAGEVHFHHSLTWHGSHANRSGRPRRAIALHYMADTTAYVAANHHLMKPFVDSRDGEPIRGAHFPRVWLDGARVPLAAFREAVTA